jgi:hypothetical protein
MLSVCLSVQGQSPTPPKQDAFLLTIFLRHDQSKTGDEINDHLKKPGFVENFPPPGVEVVSWYVMMGIGQVVTLSVLLALRLGLLRKRSRPYAELACQSRGSRGPKADRSPLWELCG